MSAADPRAPQAEHHRVGRAPALARPVAVPLYVLLVGTAALILAMVRGTLVARIRHADLQPARLQAETLLAPGTIATPPTGPSTRFLLLRIPGADRRRLALHQVYPQRRLVRWIEPTEQQGELLLLPLAGLHRGTYAVSVALPGERAGPVEMDVAPVQREELGSFTLSGR